MKVARTVWTYTKSERIVRDGQFIIDIEYVENITGDYTNVNIIPAGNESSTAALENAVEIGEYGESSYIKVYWGNNDIGIPSDYLETFTVTLLSNNKLLLEAASKPNTEIDIYIYFVIIDESEYEQLKYLHLTSPINDNSVNFEIKDIG